jgi:hypothetical protein
MNCKEVGFACGNFVAVMIIGTIMSSQLVLALQSNGASIFAPGQLNGSDSQSGQRHFPWSAGKSDTTTR